MVTVKKIMVSKKDLAARIKIVREYYGLSQAKFAESLGLKQSAYAAYEVGRVGVGIDVARKLTVLYKIS